MAQNKFQLQIEPADKVTFTSPDLAKPVSYNLKLKNTTQERLAYKVKCTSNALFRIRPPVGHLEPGATADVQLTFSKSESEPVPESNRHYFAVYHIKAPKADEKPRDTWSSHKGNADAEKRLSVDFKKDAAAKPAEDKPDEKKPAEAKKPAEEKKADEKKPADDKKPADEKKPAEEKKADEKKPAEEKTDEKKPAEEKKAEEKKGEEKKQEPKKEDSEKKDEGKPADDAKKEDDKDKKADDKKDDEGEDGDKDEEGDDDDE